MSTPPLGSFTFILHAHLPYVLAHGRWPHGMDWLCECAAESYLPVLDTLNRLVDEGYSPRLTLGLTPILTEQLADEGFKHEFPSYLQKRIDDAVANRKEFEAQGSTHLAELASMWQAFFSSMLDRFLHHYQRDLVGAFRRLQEAGHIEVITSAATHGYLPLLGSDISVQAQVKQGIASYRRHFGCAPRGFWLPECGYRPRYFWASPIPGAEPAQPQLRKGIEEFLSEQGIEYFVIDSHLLMGGEAVGVYLDRFEALSTLWRQFASQYQPGPLSADKSPYRAYLVSAAPAGQQPVAVFTRDPDTGVQVWSGEHGYPGDGWYLDFHKKHYPGGHRYWRVTSSKSDLAEKWEYEPERVHDRILENAGHFKQVVKDVLGHFHQVTGEQGIVVAPYDAELFGHWWFEGPTWLYWVLRWMNEDPALRPVTCSQHLALQPPSTVITLPEGSWGQGGFHWIWLNDWTTWTWKHVYQAEAEYQDLCRRFAPHPDPQLQAVLKQAGRELLLLESSDWQFLISTWSARDYAELRCAEHFHIFQRLAGLARALGEGRSVDPGELAFLGTVQERDRVFPDLEPAWFSQLDHPPQ